MRRRSRIGAVLLVAVLTVTGLASVTTPANADPYGGCYTDGTGCIPDSYLHTYCFTSSMDGATALRAASVYAMTNLRDKTRYSIDRQSCSASIDIRFVRSTTISARGDYTCLEKLGSSNVICRRSRIRLNPNNLANELNRRKTACHEVGHSVGLQHGDTKTDCMINGHVTSGHQSYSDHHVAHANSQS